MGPLGSYDALLLDFDGPICHVFGGSIRPSDAVGIMVDSLPPRTELKVINDDPFSLIEQALAGPRQADADYLARLLTSIEIRAVGDAPPAEGGLDLIKVWRPKPLAVVSNNSSQAVDAWLTRQGLIEAVQVIEGRPTDLHRMKPDPGPLLWAARRLGVDIDRCVFIGDSLTDGEAACAAGAPFIALTKGREGRREKFATQGCAVLIVDSMRELLSVDL